MFPRMLILLFLLILTLIDFRLNVKGKSIKLLAENIREKFYDLALGKEFLKICKFKRKT